MRKIRYGVFETNSSSMHSICISKDEIKRYPSHINFLLGEYDWSFEKVYDCASYLYTAIVLNYYTNDNNHFNKYIEKIKNLLDMHNISYNFENIKVDESGDLIIKGWIDHYSMLIDFLNDLYNDEDKLLRFICNNNSCIYTGNDNSADEDILDCESACSSIWSYKDDKYIDNPKHNEEKYDYYYKGN